VYRVWTARRCHLPAVAHACTTSTLPRLPHMRLPSAEPSHRMHVGRLHHCQLARTLRHVAAATEHRSHVSPDTHATIRPLRAVPSACAPRVAGRCRLAPLPACCLWQAREPDATPLYAPMCHTRPITPFALPRSPINGRGIELLST
jgi:hypothetical protein